MNLTQAELAKELGVEAQAISRWEKDKTSIPSSKAVAMSRLFKCSTDYLFGLSEERTVTV